MARGLIFSNEYSHFSDDDLQTSLLGLGTSDLDDFFTPGKLHIFSVGAYS